MGTDRREEGLDPRALLDSIGYRDAAGIRPVSGGWDTLIWRFTTSDQRCHSLRVHVLPEREAMAQREIAALRHCERAGFRAPRVESVCRVREMPVVVLSWVPGRPLLTTAERRPWELARLSRAFGRMQARLHSIAPPEAMTDSLAELMGRAGPEYAWLSRFVSSLQPSASALVHMDYHPLNVLVAGGQVSGVIDWTSAAGGDPRMDLARTHVTLETAPIPHGPARPLFALLRGVMLRNWLRGYEETAGAIPDYAPFKAWAAATLLAEMTRVIDRPGVWGTWEDLGRLQARLAGWALAAGCPPPPAAETQAPGGPAGRPRAAL